MLEFVVYDIFTQVLIKFIICYEIIPLRSKLIQSIVLEIIIIGSKFCLPYTKFINTAVQSTANYERRQTCRNSHHGTILTALNTVYKHSCRIVIGKERKLCPLAGSQVFGCCYKFLSSNNKYKFIFFSQSSFEIISTGIHDSTFIPFSYVHPKLDRVRRYTVKLRHYIKSDISFGCQFQ